MSALSWAIIATAVFLLGFIFGMAAAFEWRDYLARVQRKRDDYATAYITGAYAVSINKSTGERRIEFRAQPSWLQNQHVTRLIGMDGGKR